MDCYEDEIGWCFIKLLGRCPSRKHQESFSPHRQQLPLSDVAILELWNLLKSCNFLRKGWTVNLKILVVAACPSLLATWQAAVYVFLDQLVQSSPEPGWAERIATYRGFVF